MVIVPGSTSKALSKSLSSVSGIPIVEPCITRFSDGEMNVEFPRNAVQDRVVILQSLCAPANDNLMELILLADAIRRAHPSTFITAVLPYMCYARQDRVMEHTDHGRTLVSALSAKAVATLLSASQIDEIVTIDLHSSQVAGFFDVPFTNISSNRVFVEVLRGSHLLEKLVVVAPDYGALSRVRSFTKELSKTCGTNSIQIALIDKYRESPGVSEVVHVVGNVKDRHCLLFDDIIDSGGTLCNAATALRARGAVSVHGYITHGVLSGRAMETVHASELDSLVVTNSISHPNLEGGEGKIKVLSVDKLLSAHILSEEEES